MSIVYLKLAVGLALFVVACLAGLLATRIPHTKPNFFARSNSFARGVFLGAGFIHLLPDAVEHLPFSTHYPTIYALCALTIIILLFIEQGAGSYLKEQQNAQSPWIPCLLMILLSLHSLIAGAALGLENNATHLLILFIAIIAHKGAAAFALGINMHKAQLRYKNCQRLILLFACMTPFGVWIGNTMIQYIPTHSPLVSFIEAITAGTFIYIATLDKINPKIENMTALSNLSSLLLGFLLMASIAVLNV